MQHEIDQEQQRLMQSQSQKIMRVRLEKEYEYLKSLNRTYRIVNQHEVIVESILYNNNNLHIILPKEYPFRQPLYSTSLQPDVQYHVSEALESWAPHQKIFQIIELLAYNINNKYEIKCKVSNYFLLKPFHTNRALQIIIILAILLRVLVGLGAYSGAADYPNYGDFEAHRNWMSITVNRHIHSWYEEYDAIPWWRIDYPPVAAYLSFFFGFIYKNVEPEAMALQRGYQSQSLKAYMRFTVLLVELLLLFPAVILLAKQYSKFTVNIFILVFLFKPDVILIDHGHFQYNSLILGLILLSFYCILNKKYYLACLMYTIAIHSKQMAVYYSLAFFTALIGLAFRQHIYSKAKIISELLKYGLIVIIVSLIIWLPWLDSFQHISTVLTAIFPVHRGLYQLKVPNFWCISDVFMKWQTLFSKQTLLFFCFLASIIGSIPSMIALLIVPSKKCIPIAFATISMTFFMFSYHVHQKSILLPLLMIPFAGQIIQGWLTFDVTIAACMGMFHLLKEDGQQIGYFMVIFIYTIFAASFVGLRQDMRQQTQQSRSIVRKWHNSFYNSKYLRILFAVLFIALHLSEKFVTPPKSLPYLHHLLFAFFSFVFNAYFVVIGNGLQVEWILEWLQIKSKKLT